MQLVLNEEDAIFIPLDGYIQEVWLIQYSRACGTGELDSFRQRLAHCFAASLTQCLDPEFQPPTPAQMDYATHIARELGVAPPGEAFRFRGAMSEFIQRFAETFQRSRAESKCPP